MRTALLDEVEDVMRTVASQVIVPRFGALAHGDVEDKGDGDLVTVADREAEQLIAEALLDLLPGARVVGEEQTARQPDLLERLDQGDVWLIDPLDGTGNFVEGTPCFATMIALLSKGETVAAWLLDPLTDKMARAERGAGAWFGGQRMYADIDAPAAENLRGAVLVKYMPRALREHVQDRLPRISEALPGTRCAGAEYPAIATGQQDFAVFWRTLPWDHAPGALFVTEAGGVAARFDGAPYRVADERAGLLVARNRAIWDEAQRALLV
ncbi:MAG TPA: inositol monophosphatase family protein [Polyangiales bacterium]|nr:inositol monophosphatase family protein [Polyangiales bacterium]